MLNYYQNKLIFEILHKTCRNEIQFFLLQNKQILKFSNKNFRMSVKFRNYAKWTQIIPSFETVFHVTIGQKPVRGVAPLPVAASHPSTTKHHASVSVTATQTGYKQETKYQIDKTT